MPTSPVHRSRTAALLAAVLLTLAAAGCSSDGSDGASGASTSSTSSAAGGTGGATTTTGAGATTTAAPEAAGVGNLVGRWRADAGDIFGANTENLGGVALDCTGPVDLEFDDDGTFTQSSTATCTIAGQSGTATITSSGSYDASDGTITISDATSEGTMSIAGTTQPIPGAGFSDGEADYAVDGDTLEITFTVDPVGTVTQVYTRV